MTNSHKESSLALIFTAITLLLFFWGMSTLSTHLLIGAAISGFIGFYWVTEALRINNVI